MAFLRLCAGALLLLASVGAADALEVPYRQRLEAMQAAYLYQLARFVSWPEGAFAGADAPLVIAVADPALLEEVREALRGRTVHGRPVAVRPAGEGPAHLLFVHGDPRPADGVLTVGDRPGFAAAGGHIELLLRGERLRFGVNLGALRRDGLAISSEVLQLAEFVLGREGGGL